MKEIITIGIILSWLCFGIFLFEKGYTEKVDYEGSLVLGFIIMLIMSIALITYINI